MGFGGNLNLKNMDVCVFAMRVFMVCECRYLHGIYIYTSEVYGVYACCACIVFCCLIQCLFRGGLYTCLYAQIHV